MIEDHFITHCCTGTSIRNWELKNEFLNELVISVVTTLLAYQLLGWGFDILFGIKKQGEANVSDLGIVLLAQEGSVSGILSSVVPSRTICRWRYHGIQSKCTASGKGTTIFSWTALKFLVAAAMALFFAYFSNFLVIESDKVLSFRDLNFGGAALGINDDLSVVESVRYTQECNIYKTRYREDEHEMSSFLLCWRGTHESNGASNPNTTLSISQSKMESIHISIATPEFQGEYVTYANIESEGRRYRLKQNLRLADGRRLMQLGVAFVVKTCNLKNEESDVEIKEFVESSKWTVMAETKCESLTGESALSLTFSLADTLTIVDSDSFQVAELQDGLDDLNQTLHFDSGDHLPLLRRKRSPASLGVLLILCSCVLTLRFVTIIFTNNDTEKGLETILKDSLDVKCCDSALAVSAVRGYDEFRTEKACFDSFD